jgi:signal transduction histidine kinase
MHTILQLFHFNWYALPVLVVGFLMSLVGFIILSQNYRSLVNFFFFSICLCGGFWFSGMVATYSADTSATALQMYRTVSFLGVALMAPCIYLFSSVWLSFFGKQKFLGYTALAVGFVFYLVGLYSPQSFLGVYEYFWGYYPRYGPINYYFLVFFFTVLLGAFSNFFRAYFKEPPGVRKNHIGLITLAFLISLTSSLDYLPKLFYLPIYPFGFLQVFLWILIVAYAIVRNRLFDVEILTHLIQETRLSAMGLLASSINHEIKNPLFIIKGTAEAHLENSKEGQPEEPEKALERSHAAFQRISTQAQRALEIMKNFAEFGKRESGRIFDAQDHELAVILKNVLQLVGGELALDNIKLRMDIPEGLSVRIDRYSAEEIFLNLIMNACHAMSQGGELAISAKTEGPFTEILISDNGPGISANQLRNIFKPFNTSKSSGTGLGLYVVEQLTKRCQGTIQVMSEEGKGCTFTLRFPNKKCDAVS